MTLYSNKLKGIVSHFLEILKAGVHLVNSGNIKDDKTEWLILRDLIIGFVIFPYIN